MLRLFPVYKIEGRPLRWRGRAIRSSKRIKPYSELDVTLTWPAHGHKQMHKTCKAVLCQVLYKRLTVRSYTPNAQSTGQVTIAPSVSTPQHPLEYEGFCPVREKVVYPLKESRAGAFRNRRNSRGRQGNLPMAYTILGRIQPGSICSDDLPERFRVTGTGTYQIYIYSTFVTFGKALSCMTLGGFSL